MATFRLRTSWTVRARTYYANLDLNSRRYGLPATCWTIEQWRILEKQSEERPLSTTDMTAYRRVVKLMVKNRESKRILSLPSSLVTRREVHRLFIVMEELIDETPMEASTKSKWSSIFRKVVIDTSRAQTLAEHLTRTALRFRSQLRARYGPRALISDLVGESGDLDTRPPLATLHHSSVSQLLKKVETRLELDLVKIRAACISQLRAYAELRRLLTELGQEGGFSPSDLELGRRILIGANYVGKRIENWELRNQPRRMLALYRRIISEDRLAQADRLNQLLFWNGISYLNAVYPEKSKFLSGVRAAQYLFLPERMMSAELVAALVLLLTYTGWNSKSLIDMETDNIHIENTQAQIQGFKSKTGDYTPIVILDTTHTYAVESLRLLLWNRSQLINLGFIDKAQKKLWFSWSLSSGPLKHQYVCFEHALKQLQERFGLPRFSLEQIRPQKLAHEALRTRDPEKVRRIAGHQSLSTTGHYLDQLLLTRVNQAVNLEFQRRLENTVLFRLSKTNQSLESHVDKKFIDHRLLVPLGNGASCVNPEAPPVNAFLDGGLCAGKHCNEGDGCPNRRVVLNQSQLQELVRKRIYYLRNWQRLKSVNQEAFEAYHIPEILFVFGLYDYVASGRYRHYLAKIEKSIAHDEPFIAQSN